MIHELPPQFPEFQIHYYQVKNHVLTLNHSLDLVDRSYPLHNHLTSSPRLVRLHLLILVQHRLFNYNRITRFLFHLMLHQGRTMIQDQTHRIRTSDRDYHNLPHLGVILYLFEHLLLRLSLSRDITRTGHIPLDLVILVVNHHYRLNRLHLVIRLSRTIIGRVTLDPLK
jgi:hypothetical protein